MADRGGSGRPLTPDLDEGAVGQILRIARDRLGMDVMFIAEPGPGSRDEIWLGAGAPQSDHSPPLEDQIEEPQLFVLAGTEPATSGPAITVPVLLSDGRRCGRLRSARQADAAAAERDAHLLSLLAGLVADGLQAERSEREQAELQLDRVGALLQTAVPMVFQPIVDLATGQALGFEALARFPSEPTRPPQSWFAEAGELGLGVDLEIKALCSALAMVGDMPRHCFVSLNVSAPTLCSPDLVPALRGVDPARVQLELTEHELVEDYEHVNAAVTALRAKGFRLAIDDAGAGYSGLTHILSLAPDVIKLDQAIIRSIDADQARQALASSLVAYSERVGADIVAEGIETRAEVDALVAIGVGIGQGYHLARPSTQPWRALVAP
ncbi:MAG TPA: EAL domain-containing protein [Egibacteraceae bacterium]|nr:EAL domain-containing protein [Egibacteraceae bacterium]